ncbi:hypothetical protein BFL38_00665 [Brachyspira hampsonii]|uniref:Methyl-accepting transducer domain-containing protein n=1 Tax=Brachyspira hampsonii TaxID=1287055 RepID=A0A1E5NAB7_9SPIR|nr:hypothetical protein BFL38_00665 [Brachyspira hampsonii]
MEETAASMNEMAGAIKESAESVSQSTSMVLDAKESLNKAGDIVADSVNKMNDVYEASSKIMDITKLFAISPHSSILKNDMINNGGLLLAIDNYYYYYYEIDDKGWCEVYYMPPNAIYSGFSLTIFISIYNISALLFLSNSKSFP